MITLRSGIITDCMEDGNIGVIQTMVGELVAKPEYERKSNLHSFR